MLVHRRAGKFVVPLDVELRAVGNRPALSRRGGFSRRPARDRRLFVRRLVVLPPHHGQRRLVLPPRRLVRLRRILRCLRFKRLTDLFVPPALFFSFIGLARGGLLLFLLLLLSMLAAYIANQVALSSKKAELDTLQEQIDQQKTQNEEMQRILSGDSDDVTEWVARDSYNYAAANERIFVDVTGN